MTPFEKKVSFLCPPFFIPWEYNDDTMITVSPMFNTVIQRKGWDEYGKDQVYG